MTPGLIPCAHRVRFAADIVLGTVGAPAALSGLYLATLSVLPKPVMVTTPPGDSLSLTVVVPAHNEAAGIADTLRSLLQTDYPPQRRRILVIADNCSDGTAAVARACGVDVVERVDLTRRSKGYALADVLPSVLADATVDGVIIVDADTTVSPNLLTVVDATLRAGADAVQVAYGVRNADASWRTRLMSIALTCFHDVRSLGRERLGVSCGLRGNGMGFSRRALAAVPHEAHGLVEDAEHGIALALAGIRVHYVHAARVLGEMPTSGDAASTQRERWEGGRRELRRRMGPVLIRRALRRRDPVAADLAIDLCVPPLGQLVTTQVAGLAMSVAANRVLRDTVRHTRPMRSPWLYAAGLVGTAIHVGRGWQASGTGVRGLKDLAKAPAYVAWKIIGKLRRSGAPAPARESSEGTPTPWVRTPRESERAR